MKNFIINLFKDLKEKVSEDKINSLVFNLKKIFNKNNLKFFKKRVVPSIVVITTIISLLTFLKHVFFINKKKFLFKLANLLAYPVFKGERNIIEMMLDTIINNEKKILFIKVDTPKFSIAKNYNFNNLILKYYYADILYNNKTIGKLTVGFSL